MGQVFELTVRYNPETKQCEISGPIRNLELCELGLELARRKLREFHKGRIQVAHAMPTQGPPGGPQKVEIPLPNLKELLKNG